MYTYRASAAADLHQAIPSCQIFLSQPKLHSRGHVPRAARQQKEVRRLKEEAMSLIINIPFKEPRVLLTALPMFPPSPNYPGIVARAWSKTTEENRDPKETD
ncbi:hypothetical protein J3459_007765 [Metarhizium acridum]|nr:hypothetical protein J3459_007765 [Metarhizium acridum]